MKKLEESIEYIRENTNLKPKIALILGSGLGGFADKLENANRIETAHIPHYPRSTVEGHKGYLVFGAWKGVPVLAVQGRTHYYEGYTMDKVTYVVRIMKALGVKLIIVTNAAGGINRLFEPGDLMLITDQINGMFKNPLRGPLDFGGDRFPDMSNPYSLEYADEIESLALRQNIAMRRGVLYTSTGPNYESAAEIRMISRLGGDAASMSTVPEVIVANQSGIKVVGISCITNMATGISEKPLSHEEVTETANRVRQDFERLIAGMITVFGAKPEFSLS